MRDQILLSDASRLATESRTRSVNGATHTEHHQHVSPLPIGVVPLPLVQYLATSAPSIEMAVDGSSTSVSFDLTPTSSQIFRIYQIDLVMVLGSSGLMTSFGDQAELTNGITLDVLDSDLASIVDLFGGQPAKSNNDLVAVGDFAVVELGASYTYETIIKPAVPIRLDGGDGERVRLVVRDNLSTLTRLRACARGCLESTLS